MKNIFPIVIEFFLNNPSASSNICRVFFVQIFFLFLYILLVPSGIHTYTTTTTEKHPPPKKKKIIIRNLNQQKEFIEKSSRQEKIFQIIQRHFLSFDLSIFLTVYFLKIHLTILPPVKFERG